MSNAAENLNNLSQSQMGFGKVVSTDKNSFVVLGAGAKLECTEAWMGNEETESGHANAFSIKFGYKKGEDKMEL